MKYFVTLHGEEFEVDLEHASDGALCARLGGREVRVDVGVVAHLERYAVLLNRDSYDVLVDPGPGQHHLQVYGGAHDVRVEDERERAARRIGRAAAKGPVTIESVMPGIVRQILVEPGQEVTADQPLLILEAMKMENEIRAEGPGIVREILVAPETPVESGAPLIRLDAAEQASD